MPLSHSTRTHVHGAKGHYRHNTTHCLCSDPAGLDPVQVCTRHPAATWGCALIQKLNACKHFPFPRAQFLIHEGEAFQLDPIFQNGKDSHCWQPLQAKHIRTRYNVTENLSGFDTKPSEIQSMGMKPIPQTQAKQNRQFIPIPVQRPHTKVAGNMTTLSNKQNKRARHNPLVISS